MGRSWLLCLSVVCGLPGCATLREPDELNWQVLHVVDTFQTLSLARDPRYREAESAWLMGERPDDRAVFAWSLGWSVAHAGVTHLLLENDLPKLSKVWQYVTLSSLCNTVHHNAAIGIRIGQSNAGPNANWLNYRHWSNTRLNPREGW